MAKVVYGSPIDAFDKDSTLFEGLPKPQAALLMTSVTSIGTNGLQRFRTPSWPISARAWRMPGILWRVNLSNVPCVPSEGADAFAWSPDSKSLVYVSRKLKGMEYVFSTDSNLFLYNLEDGSTTLLTEGMPGYDTDPVFSPRRTHSRMAVDAYRKI